MTSLREALKAINSKSFASPRFPARTLTEIAAMACVTGERELPPRGAGKDYNSIAERLAAKIRTRQPLDSAEARDGAWCLWQTKPALAEGPDTLQGVLGGIERHDKRKPYRALASSWLASFDPMRPGMKEASSLLERRAERLGGAMAGTAIAAEILQSGARPGAVDDPVPSRPRFSSRHPPAIWLELHRRAFWLREGLRGGWAASDREGPGARRGHAFEGCRTIGD